MAAPHPALLPLIRGDDPPPGTTVTMNVVRSAEEHGVAPLVNAVLDRSAMPRDPEAPTHLAMRHLETTAQIAASDHALDTLLGVADGHDIDLCVFKGAAVGRQWYPQRDVRPITDIDILTNPHEPTQVVRLVDLFLPSATAAAEIAQESGRPFDHAIFVDGFPVDVHSDPFKLPVSPLDPATIWDRSVPISTEAGQSLRALDLESSVIVALIHGLRDNFADLLHLYDFDLLLDADPDWTFVEEHAFREGWTSLLRFGMEFACDTLNRTPPIDTALPRSTAAMMNRIWPRRLLLRGNDSVAASLRRQALAGLFITGRRTEVAGNLARRLAPPRETIESMGTHGEGAPYPVALYRWRKGQRDHLNTVRDG